MFNIKGQLIHSRYVVLPKPNHELRVRARQLRKARNIYEVMFWKEVRNKQFYKIDFDRQIVIGHFIVDFYIKDFGVVIEIDGSSHNDKKEYDAMRDEYLKSLGIVVIHFDVDEIRIQMQNVLDIIEKVIINS